MKARPAFAKLKYVLYMTKCLFVFLNWSGQGFTFRDYLKTFIVIQTRFNLFPFSEYFVSFCLNQAG